MQLDTLQCAMGTSRAEHAAYIAGAGPMWQNYMTLHANQFLEAGLKKFIVVNADGKEVGRYLDTKAANDAKAALITNADGTLRHEDFLVIRDKIIEVRRRALNGIADLEAAGLSFNVSLGEQLVGFENINEFQDAEQEMNPNSYQNNDTVFTESFVPNPITHQSFSVPWRQQGFDYKRSLGMSEAIRQVSERLEETLFNGNAAIKVSFGSSTHGIFGYTTDPNRGTGTISDWTNAANNDVIITETIREIGNMWNNQGGVGNDSVVIYVANDIWTVLQNDYNSAFPSKTIKDRMMDIAQVKDVKPAEKLATKQVVMVEMEQRTVEIAKASDIITVPHIKTSPMSPQVLTIYAAMVHKIKSDSNGNTGVRHLTV